ncbi:MAG: Hdr-like menaquinol oxidoreductase cytochrome c subunit [Alphaproteobacteria bacterium]|jgi:hypothetical protein|nr:Hdr-like menaquinol oxidoreductase cytochrome c subunit [Rhodospirillaceae bacterium]MDP6020365.1 Hdr-like menaquinol oxidoreductase cytochrome c subunit [Alphaproteobacteria bacterium]MDP6256458.1 Hdr-like menaquinol oxidoreductase cytochrome c subunit [Alphaproteobacteria bacterium]MDP7053832.1 Hdr-like menaquinol oxidoreductase cytochrome c subunit [Alphaproteobacteria bacterium]MDP7227197.1 Hdr-like menaquinol oxidoreductase cytochrome c subunit [Alphaproteobacteria bacterium]|tara:strand:- start:9109 stop:9519 length:411 start_codon:yes stop_codon:yes gene_type:complete
MRAVLIMVAALFLISLGDGDTPACAGGLQPTVPKAKGGTCVRDAAFMRANHMNFLSHRRDASVREGRRALSEKLAGCLDCHAVAGSDGHAVGFDNPKHFCRACHDYAAVRIDCFECHNAKPGPLIRQSSASAGQAK